MRKRSFLRHLVKTLCPIPEHWGASWLWKNLIPAGERKKQKVAQQTEQRKVNYIETFCSFCFPRSLICFTPESVRGLWLGICFGIMGLNSDYISDKIGKLSIICVYPNTGRKKTEKKTLQVSVIHYTLPSGVTFSIERVTDLLWRHMNSSQTSRLSVVIAIVFGGWEEGKQGRGGVCRWVVVPPSSISATWPANTGTVRQLRVKHRRPDFAD